MPVCLITQTEMENWRLLIKYLEELGLAAINIGVVNYGGLGHVPPRLPAIYFFQLTLELHQV